MQKTTRLQRLLAVIVAVFMAVCCLPLSVFATDGGDEASTYSIWNGKIDVTFKFEGDGVPESESTYKTQLNLPHKWSETYSVKEVVGDNLPAGYVLAEEDQTFKVSDSDMYCGVTVPVKVVREAKKVDFTIKYVCGTEELATKSVHFEYTDASEPTDAWTYFAGTDEFKELSATYEMENFVVPFSWGSSTYTQDKPYSITDALNGMEITVNLTKISTQQTVNFEIHFVSDDGTIDDTKSASAPYDEFGTIYDAWDFVVGTGSYQNYAKEGYELKNFVVAQPAGDATYTGAGQFSITPSLEGKVITANLGKVEEPSTVEYVDFTIHFVSADGKIDETKSASVSYDEYGTVYDAWNYFLGTGSYKNYAKEGYQMVNFVVPHAAGDATYTAAGQFSITPALAGMTVTVNLEKPVVSEEKSTYTFNFYETNNKSNVLHEPVTVTVTDFDNLVDKYVMDLFATARKEIEDAGNWTYNFYESEYGLEGDVDALVVPGVNLSYNVYFNCKDRSSKYTIHFVDENNNEFQDPAVVNMAWVEGQDLNLMTQLDSTLKNVDGYTFKSLTAWNGTEAYKGDEKVVPGEYELIAHYAKKTTSSSSSNTTTVSSSNNNTTTTAASTEVVKSAAPADNTTKVMPQTGLTAETPVVFAVMMVAALAGAGAYLFALRKKLN